MPLPHFSTVYLHMDRTVNDDTLSIGQLGRLHFTRAEVLELDRKGKREMAFKIVAVSDLPVREFGRKATEPRITISDMGRFSFNSLIKENWGETADKILIQFDDTTNKLAFRAFPASAKIKDIKPNDFINLAKAKPDKNGKGGGDLSASGAPVLNSVKYDFKAAGNQSYPAVWEEKGKIFVMQLPKETPARKPVQTRKKRTTPVAGDVVAKSGANGAASVVPPAAPAAEELLEL